jgi:hypothetical protein
MPIDLGADGDPLDEAGQLVHQEAVALVAAVPAHLAAGEAG